MKIIYFFILSFILLCCNSLLHAQNPQENWVLDSLVTGTKTYVARESITLKPGFTYTASSGNTFSAKIDQTLVFPPTENTYADENGNIVNSPTQGAVVGNFSGAFDVSPSGAAVYSVPIEVPPGIQGMQPNISLVYNSQGGNGIAGWGFNIAGLSAVTRVPKTVYSDTHAAGIKNLISDGYALDGNRLILSTGTYGANNAVYNTEIETYSKITSKVSSNIGNGPDWFEVQAKDGTIYKYGSVSGSNSGKLLYNVSGKNSVQAWMLDSVKNTNGQTIIYEYEHTNRYSYLKKIKYGDNTIEFTYETRTDIIPIHFDQAKGFVNKRLNKITTSTSGTIFREYHLNYTFDIFSRLEKVTEKNRAGESFNPTVFDWGTFPTSTNITTTDITVSKNSSDPDFSKQSYSAVDFNGDGLPDLVGFYPKDGGIQMYVHTAHKDANGNISYTTPTPYLVKSEYSNTKILGNSIVDQRGTGKQDIIFPVYEECKGGCMINFFYKNKVRAGYVLKSCKEPVYTVGDLDNDGKTDIVYFEDKHTYFKVNEAGILTLNSEYPGVFFSGIFDGKYGEESYVTHFNLEGTFGTPERLFIADFDGDGMNDLMILTKNNYTIFWNQGDQGGGLSSCFSVNNKNTYTHFGGRDKYDVIALGDYNGDGLPDFVVNTKNNAEWHIVINNGDKTFTSTKSTVISNLNIIEDPFTDKNDDKDICMVIDFDGDGKSDLVISDAKYVDIIGHPFVCHAVYWLRSTGTDFELVNKVVPYMEKDALSKYFVTGDFSGNGQQELMFYGYECFGNTSTEQKWRLYKNPDFTGNSGKITTITDGMNNKTQLEYTPLTNNSVYSKQGNATFPVIDIKAPLYVAKQSTVNYGTNDYNTTTYTYTGAKVHVQGKGFLGFSEVLASNSILNRKTTTKYAYDNTYYYPHITEQKVTTVSGSPIATTILTNKIKVIDSSKKRIFPYVSKQTATDNLTTLFVETETDSFDNYGNPLTIKTTKGGVVTTQTMEYIQKGSWCDNKPKWIKTNQTYTGDTGNPVNRDEYFFYDNKGNLTQHTKDSTHINKVRTHYSYDQYGNPLKITTKANDATGNLVSRSQTLTYTSSGRFVKTKKNDQFNETTTYNWDEKKGVLDSQTDRLGTTSYQYDGFGRLKLTTYPDGIKTANALQWAGTISGKPTNAKYYSYSETSGGSPVWVWYDNFGREIRKDAYGLNNQKIYTDTEYYTTEKNKGRLYQVSEPYFANSNQAKIWAATYTYDKFGRDSTVVTPMGTTTYTYPNPTTVDLTTTVVSPAGTKKTKVNTAGWVVEEETNGKKVNFTHYASGQVKTATPVGGTGSITMEYNLQGNRTKLTDPSAGVITSKYDGWGQLVRESQKIHSNTNDSVVTTYTYHPSGLLKDKLRKTGTATGETTSYTYDNLYRLQQVSIAGKHSQSYVYDNRDRIAQVTDVIENNKTFVTKTEYDQFGRIDKEIYPTGYYTINGYDKYSNLTSVKDRSNRLIWQALEENAKGQLTRTKSGNKETVSKFNAKGFPESITTAGVSEWKYVFDNKGNLASRRDVTANYKDSMAYDNLNRLTSWNVYQGATSKQSNSMTYDPDKGTITTKSGVGYTMGYGGAGKPAHALTSISGVPNGLPTDSLGVTYTDFKKINTLTQGTKNYALSYGVGEQRTKSVYKVNNVAQETRYYLGDYEETTNNAGVAKKIHYLSGGAILVITGDTETLYYGYYDHLGSLIALTNESGTVQERYAYDPWGNRRNPTNWEQADSRTTWLVNRGYTMHEHLDAFGIINMNGRVYDPLTAQFFSPDPQLQAPGNWLNYNRYSYAFNNPLIYTDPSGENPLLIVALVGFATGYVSHGLTTDNWGMNAVYSGLFTAAGFTAGYAGQAFQLFNSGNLLGTLTHLSTQGAWKFAGIGVLNTALSHVMPPVNIPLSNNFGISISPMAMLTSGISSSAGGGFSLGAGIGAHLQLGDWTLSAGLNTQGGRIGSIYGGFAYDDGKYGFSYYHNWYQQGGKQQTGIIGGRAGDWSFRWENDVKYLAGDGHDRFRSNATEIGYKDFVFGTNVYTTDPDINGKENYALENGSQIFNNKFGTYEEGKQLSSPLYIGMRGKHGITRIGYNLPGFGDFFQNGFHHLKFPGIVWGIDAIRSPNFRLGNYSNPYYQSGRYKPYSLY